MSLVRSNSKIYDDRVTEEILRFITMGYSEGSAVGRAGVHPMNYARWMSKGYNDPDGVTIYGQFYIQVQRAKAVAEQAAVEKVLLSEDWRAATWILEHRDDENWGERRRIEIDTGPSPEDISALRKLPAEELERMLATGNYKALAEAKIIEHDEPAD